MDFRIFIALTNLSASTGIHFLFGTFLSGLIVSEIVREYEDDNHIKSLLIKFE